MVTSCCRDQKKESRSGKAWFQQLYWDPGRCVPRSFLLSSEFKASVEVDSDYVIFSLWLTSVKECGPYLWPWCLPYTPCSELTALTVQVKGHCTFASEVKAGAAVRISFFQLYQEDQSAQNRPASWDLTSFSTSFLNYWAKQIVLFVDVFYCLAYQHLKHRI